MIGMVLAVAVTAGASLSAAGSGALQQALRAVGFGRDSEIAAEQRKQAGSIADLERIIGRMDNEIGSLTTRMTRSEANETTTSDLIAKVDGDLTTVTNEVKELHQRSEAAAGDAWRKPIDHLNAAVTGARTDIIDLRSSLDAYDQMRRNDVGVLTRRIERVERALAARDATSSIPNGGSAGRGETATGGGVMDFLGLRGSGASEATTGHVIDMGTPAH
jgi:chromosome segregation ATPase